MTKTICLWYYILHNLSLLHWFISLISFHKHLKFGSSKTLQFLTAVLDIERMDSERESLNISLIETFHSFNFLNVQLYLYQNWESEDCLISSRIIWGTPTKLSESVSLSNYKDWHLFIVGYASASIVSFWNNFLDFWRLFDFLKVF